MKRPWLFLDSAGFCDRADWEYWHSRRGNLYRNRVNCYSATFRIGASVIWIQCVYRWILIFISVDCHNNRIASWCIFSLWNRLCCIPRRNQPVVNRFGKFVGIKQSDVDSAFRWFERYGTFVIFFGRLIPLIRSLVSIPAGLAKMNLVRFSLLTAAGSGIWNALWISIGVQLGDRWREAEGWLNILIMQSMQ